MTLEEMFGVSGARSVLETGDGSLLYSEVRGDETTLHVDGDRIAEVDGELGDFTLDADGRTVYALTYSSDHPDIVSIDPHSGAVEHVRQNDQMIAAVQANPIEPGTLGLVSNRSGIPQVYELDVATGDVSQITDSPEPAFFFDYSPDGTRIVYQVAHNDTSLHITDTDSQPDDTTLLNFDGSKQMIVHHGSYTPSVWSEAGILFCSNHDEYFDIGLFDPDGTYEWLLESTRDDIPLAWNPDGGSAFAFVRKVNDSNNLGIYDDGAVEFLTDSGTVHDIAWSADGSLAYTLANYRSPGDVWVDDHLEYEVGRQDAAELAEPETVEVEAPDGVDVPGYIYESEETKTSGRAVVYVHGTSEKRPVADFRRRAQSLVQNGFTVFVVNYRGTTGFGQSYRKLSEGEFGRGDVLDIVAAGEYLHEAGYDSVGLIGHFAGAYLSLLAETRSDVFGAVVAISAMTDIAELAAERPLIGKYAVDKLGGTPDEIPEVYRERSPAEQVEEIDSPVMMVHGEQNRRVPPSQATQFADQLSDADVHHRLVTYEGEGHYISGADNQIDLMERTVDFFDSAL